MNQIKLLLIGVLILGVILFGAGIYLALAPGEVPVVQTSQVNTITTPINTPPPPTSTKINKTITVPMNTAWTDANLTVTSGQTVIINASGKGVWKNISKSNPNAVPSPYEECSPEGTPQNSSDYWSNIHQYQTRAANKGALIGRIGTNGIPFKVGSNLSKKFSESGKLYLGINDMKQEIDSTSYNDNSGNFEARIEIK